MTTGQVANTIRVQCSSPLHLPTSSRGSAIHLQLQRFGHVRQRLFHDFVAHISAMEHDGREPRGNGEGERDKLTCSHQTVLLMTVAILTSPAPFLVVLYSRAFCVLVSSYEEGVKPQDLRDLLVKNSCSRCKNRPKDAKRESVCRFILPAIGEKSPTRRSPMAF